MSLADVRLSEFATNLWRPHYHGHALQFLPCGSMNGHPTYLGLDAWNVLRFSTAFTGLTCNGIAIWEHSLVLIVLSVVFGGTSQLFNLVRHSKNGNGNGTGNHE